MAAYADTSFLVALYSPEVDAVKALTWIQRATEPLPFTPFHRHEIRTALRLRVFRGELTADQRKEAFREIESDLTDNILIHTAIPWTDAFREAETIAELHAETIGVRSLDLLHVGIALALRASHFLTFDSRQAQLATVTGLKVKP
jgi:predicted nucleic acid-binding protein